MSEEFLPWVGVQNIAFFIAFLDNFQFLDFLNFLDKIATYVKMA